MNQQGEDNNTQIRSCPRCSVAQSTQVRRTTEYAVEQQDPVGVSSLCLWYSNRFAVWPFIHFLSGSESERQ